MIRYTIYTLCFLLSFATLSCHKDEEKKMLVDFNTKKANIVGDWSINTTVQWFKNGAILIENNDMLEISLFEDGTGTRLTDSSTIAFEWLYQYNPEAVIILDSDIAFSLIKNPIFRVLKNEKNKQTWKADSNGFGNWDVILHTWKMNRQ